MSGIKKWPLLAVVLLGLGLLLSACGEEAAEDPPGALPATRLNLADCTKAGASLTAPANLPTATPNPNAGVRVDLPPGTRLYLSNPLVYAFALPEGWEVKEGQSQGNIKGDLFIIKKTPTSGAFVTVLSDKVADNIDSKTFFDQKYKEATASQKITYEQQTPRNVSGVPAYVLAYNTETSQPFAYPTQSLQMLFVAGGRGWNITFTASPTYAAQYCPYFARMLDSWTLTGLVTN